MKLYGLYGSGNVRKVQAVADALELPLQMEWLSFPEGEHKSARYLALNPNGKVPTLVDGDLVLWESNAINRYLCSKVPGNSLYPDDPGQRAGVDQWLAWELAHYNQAFGTLAWETVAKPRFMNLPPDEAIAAWATEQLARYAAVLEAHLDGRRTVLGDGVTLADYALIHIETFKDMMPFDWSPYPRLNAYYERMRADAHWQATAVDMSQVGR